MPIYTDERGPYILEAVSNADVRRCDKSVEQFGELTVGTQGKCAYVELSGAGHLYVIFFFPHAGEGEPRPQT